MNEPIINIKNLYFAYNGHSALEDIELSVEERNFLCITGPNGGGKTTLLKIILGLIKPLRGSISVFGTSPAKVRSKIGYMPQHASIDPLFPISLLDVVLMGRLGKNRFGFFGKKDIKAAESALMTVGLDKLKNRSFSELSGGEQRRGLMARAIASEPILLLLDEPTSNVDANTQKKFYQLLKLLNEKITIVLVTHDMDFVSSYVKKTICINRNLSFYRQMSGE